MVGKMKRKGGIVARVGRREKRKKGVWGDRATWREREREREREVVM
jgi:hypothetical protein